MNPPEQPESEGSWTIRVCECGEQTYEAEGGGEFPIGGCRRERRCGIYTEATATSTGPINYCPSTHEVEVVPASPTQQSELTTALSQIEDLKRERDEANEAIAAHIVHKNELVVRSDELLAAARLERDEARAEALVVASDLVATKTREFKDCAEKAESLITQTVKWCESRAASCSTSLSDPDLTDTFAADFMGKRDAYRSCASKLRGEA